MRYTQPQGLGRLSKIGLQLNTLMAVCTSQFDYAKSAPASINSTPTFEPGFIRLNSGDARLYRQMSSADKTDSYSYLLVCRSCGTPSAFASMFGSSYDDVAVAPYGDGIDRSDDGAHIRLYFTLGGTNQNITVTDTISSTTFDVFVCRVTSGRQEVYKNGTLIGASSYSGNPVYSSASKLIAGSMYGYARNPAIDLKLGARFGVYVSDAEVISLTANPWQIFADNKKPIFIGGGAAPSGLSITTELATASASGYAATVNLQSAIPATLATATASGFTANVGTGNAITAILAMATASGQTATVNQQSNIAATQAVASASGNTATVNQQLAFAATLATATAAGQTSTVNLQRSVVASQAVATATGHTANVQLGNDLSISATQAIATASGFDAAINRQLSIVASVATATASGLDAGISNSASLAASYGLASADGYQAQINLQREIDTSLATAIASGVTAVISIAGSAFEASVYSAISPAKSYTAISPAKSYTARV